MKMEIKAKELYDKIYPVLSGVTKGGVEIKPGVVLSINGELNYTLIHTDDGFSITFPKGKLKVTASKWVFSLDGFISRIDFLKSKVNVIIENMPNLQIDIV